MLLLKNLQANTNLIFHSRPIFWQLPDDSIFPVGEKQVLTSGDDLPDDDVRRRRRRRANDASVAAVDIDALKPEVAFPASGLIGRRNPDQLPVDSIQSDGSDVGEVLEQDSGATVGQRESLDRASGRPKQGPTEK